MNQYMITTTTGHEFTTTGDIAEFHDGELYIRNTKGEIEAVFTHLLSYNRVTIKQSKRAELEDRLETMEMKYKDAVSSFKAVLNSRLRVEREYRTLENKLTRANIELYEADRKAERMIDAYDKRDVVKERLIRHLKEENERMKTLPKRKW